MPTLAELAEKTKVAEELWMTTRRSDGSTASFPLWFVHDGDRLYILSAESSSEVWDVKGNPNVEIAIGGKDSGDKLKTTGEIMTDPSWVPMMVEMLQKKYAALHAERMGRVAEVASSGHVIIKLKPVTQDAATPLP